MLKGILKDPFSKPSHVSSPVLFSRFLQETVNLKGFGKPKAEPEKKEPPKIEEPADREEGRLMPKRKRPELQKMPEKKPPPEKKEGDSLK